MRFTRFCTSCVGLVFSILAGALMWVGFLPILEGFRVWGYYEVWWAFSVAVPDCRARHGESAIAFESSLITQKIRLSGRC